MSIVSRKKREGDFKDNVYEPALYHIPPVVELGGLIKTDVIFIGLYYSNF